MRFHTVVTAYTLWVLAIFGVFYLAQGKDNNALQFALMCGVIPAVCQIFLLGVDWRGLVAPVKMWLALLLVILLSYLASGMDPRTAPGPSEYGTIPVAWTPLVYTINTLFILVIATLIAGCPDRRLLRSIASLYCLLFSPFLVYIIVTGERVWGRLTEHLEPNLWGLMGLTVCVGAFARKLGPLSIGAFAVGLIVILEASSREHLLALGPVVLAIIALNFRTMNRSRVVTMLAISCVMFSAAAVLLDPYIFNAVDYLKYNVFLIDSPDRGLNSGFTGRSDIWAATIELWLKSPIIGIGFRQHEQFIAVPAHNAYLAMLADTGLIGLIWYLVLLVGSLIAAWGMKDERTRRFIVTMIVSYIIVGFFDRRTINAGNPYGLFFVMCCSAALADQSLRKAAKAWRKPLATEPTPAGYRQEYGPGVR